MRETFFEGTPAKIPFAYKEILEAEYNHKALTLTEFEKYATFPFPSRPLAHPYSFPKMNLSNQLNNPKLEPCPRRTNSG